jgi:hypothetical protein
VISIINRTSWHNQYYHFHFDANLDNDRTRTIKGWFVNKSLDNYSLVIIDKALNKIEEIECSKNRRRLSELYPEIKNVNYSGFEVDTKTFPQNGKYTFAVFKNSELIAKVLAVDKIIPLLYVHIAKTAGSTVNKVLTDWFGKENSLVHAESETNWVELVKLQAINFLSGHIEYKRFIQSGGLQHYKKAITFREPYSHVISHLSWIRALALAENKSLFELHPQYIQELSRKLANYDLTSANQISDLTRTLNAEEFRLLDNTQTRYIRTDLVKVYVEPNDLAAALKNLKHFDFIGIDDDISSFLLKIAADYSFDYGVEERRENVRNNKFGLDIDNEDIRKALLPLIKYDLDLYDAAKKFSLSIKF